MTLTADQCSLIAQVLPVLLLTLAIERRWAFALDPPWLPIKVFAIAIVFLVAVAEVLAIVCARNGATASQSTVIWSGLALALLMLLGAFAASVIDDR